jgi:hypothetical protein
MMEVQNKRREMPALFKLERKDLSHYRSKTKFRVYQFVNSGNSQTVVL